MTSNMNFWYQVKSNAADRKWFSQWCLTTYSIQYTASSAFDTNRSFIILDLLFAFSLYLKQYETLFKIFFWTELWIMSTYFGFLRISFIALVSASSVSSLMGILMAYSRLTALAMFNFWSPKTGIPIMGTPWYKVSIVLSNPPWDINANTFGWANTSDCCTHFRILTLDGKFVKSSASNFHNTFCFSFENARSMCFLFSEKMSVLFKRVPILKYTTPPVALSKKCFRSFGSSLGG